MTKKTNIEIISDTLLNRSDNSVEFNPNDASTTRAKAQNYVAKKQFKVVKNNERYYKSTAVDSDRISAYVDFDTMEYYPITAAAMDLFAEECTSKDEKNNILNVYSNNPKVKKELQDLFYNTLNCNTNLFFWARNLVKYGNYYLLLLLNNENGVSNVKSLGRFTERLELWDDEKDDIDINFKDLENNQTYTYIQTAHFRLKGDENMHPYGQSIFEKVRKTHKQLVIAEDALMIKRLTRSTQRLVYKIDVGNIDDDDIESYIEAIGNKFKRQLTTNNHNSNTDFKFNIVDVTQDYFIPVRNGNSNTSIDTISTNENLDQIADIEMLRDNLFTGLGIPKSFLSFEDGVGEGKSLTILDNRFSRKIQRIQESLIEELNKIAKIHLFLKGYIDDFENFVLTLHNPSIQKKIVELELLDLKLGAYEKAITISDNTEIAAMSDYKAKKTIFGWSDDEIILDLKRQYIERGLGETFRNELGKIDMSSLFKDIMKAFPNNNPESEKSESGDEEKDSGNNPFEENFAINNIVKKVNLLAENFAYLHVGKIKEDKSENKLEKIVDRAKFKKKLILKELSKIKKPNV